jgi:superfamily II DNA or RNA helicase
MQMLFPKFVFNELNKQFCQILPRVVLCVLLNQGVFYHVTASASAGSSPQVFDHKKNRCSYLFLNKVDSYFILKELKSLPGKSGFSGEPIQWESSRYGVLSSWSLSRNQISTRDYQNIRWSVRFVQEHEGPIQILRQEPSSKSPEEVSLVIPEGTLVTSHEFQKLLSQWLVGHPAHPYLRTDVFQYKEFQKEALEAYRVSRSVGDKKFILVAPGGSGKTVVLDPIIKQELQPGKIVVVVTDHRFLIRQLQEFLSPQKAESPESLTVTHKWGDGESSSNMNLLSASVLSGGGDQRSHLLFSTTASFKMGVWKLQESEQGRRTLERMSFVVYDEAHRLGAPQIKELFDSWFLQEKAPFLFGITATPIHARENILDIYDHNVFWAYLDTASSFLNRKSQNPLRETKTISETKDMGSPWKDKETSVREMELSFEDRKIFSKDIETSSKGKEALYKDIEDPSVESSFNKESVTKVVTQMELAMNAGDITPFHHVTIMKSFDPSLEKTSSERSFFVQEAASGNRFVLDQEMYPEVFSKLKPLLESKSPGFITASTIKESERIYENLQRAFPDKKFALIHSEMSEKEIPSLIESIRKREVDFVISVRMLDEGLNFPHFRTYIDLTPSFNPRQLIQRLSRTTRLSEGKTAVDMVFFYLASSSNLRDSIETFDQMLKNYSKRSSRTLTEKEEIQDLREGRMPQDSPNKDPFYFEVEKLKASLQNFWENHFGQLNSQDRRIQELNNFIRDQDRMPSRGKLASIEERKLTEWFANFKFKNLDWVSLLDADVQLKVRENKWDLGQRKSQEERLAELNNFIRDHKRLPSQKQGSSIEEKPLTDWFTNFKSENLDWVSLLDGDVQLLVRQNQWDLRKKKLKGERLTEFNNFIHNQNRMPFLGKESSVEEKELGRWLIRLKYRNPDWVSLLDADVQLKVRENKWDLGQRKSQEERLAELNNFIRDQDRMPSGRKDPSVEEKELVGWFAQFKSENSDWVSLLDGDVQLLVRQNQWDLVRQMKSQGERLTELNNFIRAQNRMPFQRKESSFEEKELAKWVIFFKSKNLDWVSLLDTDVQLLVRQNQLDLRQKKAQGERLTELSNFIRDHKRMPSLGKEASAGERKLAEWSAVFKYKNPDWVSLLDADVQLLVKRESVGFKKRKSSKKY